MNTTLSEAKRLYDLGFGILWLKPKSKAPVNSRWTTGPRESWGKLMDTYQQGFNVGVRLGAASKVGDKYLAVLDVDVKSTYPKHQLEAQKCIIELFPDLPKNVCQVLSGRGNGSMHCYIGVATPARSLRLRASSDRVKTMMPSAPINPTQEKLLSKTELEAGWRIRPAWEISVMGEGSQVVLPPSTHPDTGRAYSWKSKLESTSDLVFVSLDDKQVSQKDRTATQDWVPEQVDLAFSTLTPDIIDDILYADVEDRSATLFKVVIAMVRALYTDRQIMSVCTDPNYELSRVAYDHAKTDSRARAANWVFNYTIKKARSEADARFRFDSEVEAEVLTPEASEAQAKDLVQEPSWQDKLDLTRNGKINVTLNNVLLILENMVGSGLFKRDVFALNDMYGTNTPWGGIIGQPITDDEVLQLKVWFTKKIKIEPSRVLLEEAITSIALANAFHPVRDFLDTLVWDGKPRLDGWLKRYLKAGMPEPYLSDVSRKTLCAMVARIYHPGIKFDSVLILNGAQGVGKSTAAQILASPPWFLDRLPDLRDKDSMLNLQGIWVVEMGELTNMRASSVETYKAFLSSQVDKFRLPYGSRRQDFKRQCIIIGSSNPVEFLNDSTGNRRFWPVRVKQCDFAALARDRDQLLAEAKWVWQNCEEKLYLEGLSEKQSVEIQQNHMHEDVDVYLEERWDEQETKETKFKLETLFQPLQVFGHLQFSKDAKRVAKLLRKKGYVKHLVHGGQKWWVVKDSPDLSINRAKSGVTDEA